ncbi:reverse transcriptase family protein, partial [Staphylococcus aureus]|nr:reverse transcriptase family protein [Staphylococcus aureus]
RQTEAIPLDPAQPDKQVTVGQSLPPQLKADLIQFLRDNSEVFAWSAEDIPGIDPTTMVHCLNINSLCKPVAQKKRRFAPERLKIIDEEVDKLLKAKFIRSANYPQWISNVVLVPKPNGKWRMCVDFTDLNKACPKDSFPLPNIDHLVDRASGNRILSFMDAFAGYNQIPMNPDDEEHTTFITERGLYCYRHMPFGLKNAGTTYQRLVKN